jgi:hypothetical protein
MFICLPRYPIGGGVRLPLFKNWVEEKFKVDLSDKRPTLSIPNQFPDCVLVIREPHQN